MTNILKPKNPNPNNILTYNYMPLKRTWFPWMPCLKIMIEKAFKLINEPDSLMLQGKLFQSFAPL